MSAPGWTREDVEMVKLVLKNMERHDLVESVTNAMTELDLVNTKLAELQVLNADLRKNNAALSTKNHWLEDVVAALEESNERLYGDLSELQEQSRHDYDKIAELDDEVNYLRQEYESLDDEYSSVMDALRSVNVQD